jgi:hypothetical protein
MPAAHVISRAAGGRGEAHLHRIAIHQSSSLETGLSVPGTMLRHRPAGAGVEWATRYRKIGFSKVIACIDSVS